MSTLTKVRRPKVEFKFRFIYSMLIHILPNKSENIALKKLCNILPWLCLVFLITLGIFLELIMGIFQILDL